MLHSIHTKAGKVTVVTVLLSVIAIFSVFFFDLQHGAHIQTVTADTATTSVTVLNIPPNWTASSTENPASATTSPTNVGTAVTWTAIGTDGNGEPYFLLICKDGTAPTARRNDSPQCNGAGQWAVSASTTSGVQASTTYTVLATDTFESYDWYAFICDANAGSPGCNLSSSGHESSADNKAPFSVNHRPFFTLLTAPSPTLPDGTAIWTATAYDNDSAGGSDTVRLYVCTTLNFTVGGGCTDGTWATSTLVVSNPTASAVITAPRQDGEYPAYGFIVDEHSLAALAGQGTSSPLTVANATPTVSNVAFATSTLVLSVEQGETYGAGFSVIFDVTDANSCVANGSTTPEITGADINVFRSGIGSTSCMAVGDYDPNHCYTGTRPLSTWNVSCSQTGGNQCLGPTDDTVTWTCTFPLWYVADPTDVGAISSPYNLQNWLATALAGDNNGATSSLAQTGSGSEVQQFLSFDLATTSISYGSFQPGQGNASTSQSINLLATGNTGLDENLLGTAMCTTYPSCSGNEADTIPASQQHFAGSVIAYGSGTALATTTQEFELDLTKTTSTSSPATKATYWGIQVPSAISLSGDYIGVNALDGKVAETVDW